MKRAFYYLELPLGNGILQQSFLFKFENKKFGIVGSSKCSEFYFFDSAEIERQMKEKTILPRQPQDIKGFDALIKTLSSSNHSVPRNLVENFIYKNKLREQEPAGEEKISSLKFN